MTLKKKPDHFNCADVETLAQQYLDNQLDEEQIRLFNEHLEYCLPCDKKIEFEKKFKEIIRQKTRDKAPVSFLKSKLSKILDELS